MQTRLQSFIESCTHIAIGFILNLIFQIIIYHALNIKVNFDQNIMIGIYFTFISLTRTYLIRRYFNKKHSNN